MHAAPDAVAHEPVAELEAGVLHRPLTVSPIAFSGVPAVATLSARVSARSAVRTSRTARGRSLAPPTNTHRADRSATTRPAACSARSSSAVSTDIGAA